jgi:acetyl esterase/lipase
VILRGSALGLLLGIAGLIAFNVSPRPGVQVIRFVFDRGSLAASAALEKHLPAAVGERLDLVYDPADPDARLDLFFPAPDAKTRQPLPVLVWIHGGAWVSGDENQIANYARIVAARGFAVASVNYTLAPEARYPTPVRQVNSALRYLKREAPALSIDPARLFLTGDSAGAQIAAQVAAISTDPDYAQALGIAPAVPPADLRGLALFCGGYDLETISTDGAFGGFLETVLWAYSGHRDFKNAPGFATFSVAQHVTADFPPVFISAGNADPLLSQSVEFAERLRTLGVTVKTLFFPQDYEPGLPHEYQFNLDHAPGREALETLITFLTERSRTDPAPLK